MGRMPRSRARRAVLALCFALAVPAARAAAGGDEAALLHQDGGAGIWSRIRELFSGSRTGRGDPAEPACDFDDLIRGEVEPAARDIVVPPKKKAWEAALGGEEAAKPHIKARLRGWPSAPPPDREPLPRGDAEFLRRIARDTWAGLDAFTDRANGLPIDNVRFGPDNLEPAAARVGDYTSVTNIGVYLIAVVAAHELGIIPAPEAAQRLVRILDTLSALERHQGFFFNFYDTTSLERTSNFVSFVDSSWLTAGLIVVRASFPELAPRCTEVIEQGDYRFFYDEALQRMSHGYYVNRSARSKYHYGMLYAESRLGSLIAIGKGEAPSAHWFQMVRTFPPACGWQTQAPKERVRKAADGHAVVGGYYDWRGIAYVPSWGGSMFEALMPTLVLDELRYAPRGLGANGVAHATVQRRYALEQLGYPVWGMSPCSTTASDGYGEYGVAVLGAAGYPAGPVTPHGAALALGVAPEAAIGNLRRLAERYDVYGEFGFYDAVDAVSGTVARAYLALDQSMLFIAVANALKDHCIQKRFASDPIVQRALPVLAGEDFFDGRNPAAPEAGK